MASFKRVNLISITVVKIIHRSSESENYKKKQPHPILTQ